MAGHWHGSSRSHCQREVPTAGAGASCFPWFPHPQRPSRRASQCLFDPPKYTHTHTHSPVQAHTGQTLRQEATTQQDLSAGFSPRARRCGRPCGTSICGVHLHTWACDGRRTQQSQPASQPDSDEHGNGLGEVGRWEREEGSISKRCTCRVHATYFGLNPRSLPVLVSLPRPLSISLLLSRFTSVHPSWCLAPATPSPPPPRGRSWRGNKASEGQEATNPPWVDLAV